MKKRLILFVALVALALVAWGLIRESSLEGEIMLPKLSFDESSDRIDIAFEGTPTTLIKDEKSWKVRDVDVLYPSDTDAINEVAETLSKLELQDIVSKNKDRYAVLGFEEVGVVGISWFEKDVKKGSLHIGHQDYTRGGDYVRLGEDGPVYLTAVPIRSIFAHHNFKDLGLVNVSDTALVSKIAREDPDAASSLTLVKKQDDKGVGEWIFENDAGVSVNQDAVQTFVSSLLALRAEDVKQYDKNSDYGFGSPAITVSITVDSKDEVITIGKSVKIPRQVTDLDAYYARVSGKDEWVYLISSSSVDQLMKQRVDFEKKEGA